MILDSSVGRARVHPQGAGRVCKATEVATTTLCDFRVAWQGATRRMAAPCNEEQRGQAIRKPCNRVRSGLSRWVNALEAEMFSIYPDFQGTGSGQLRNQG